MDIPEPEGTPTQPPPDSESEGSLTEKIILTVGGVADELAQRLRQSLTLHAGSGHELAMLARPEPITVRASKPAAVTAARLVLPAAAATRLGSAIETQIVADGEQLRLWISGATEIRTGATVALLVITPEGELAETTTTAADPTALLELSLPWTFRLAPEAVGLVIELLGQSGSAPDAAAGKRE